MAYNPIGIIPQQTNINQNTYFFLTANASSINVNSISSGQITAGFISSQEAFINDIDCLGISTSAIDLDGQTLTATSSNLLLNGVPIATASNLSSIADWSLEPAISDVNMNGFNLLSTNLVSTNTIRATNALFQNLIAYNSLFVSTATSTISSVITITDLGLYSTLNSDNISSGFIEAGTLSSLIHIADLGLFSTINVDNLSTSSLFVSSINGSEFTSTGINIQVAGISSLVTNAISSLGSEIRQGLFSTIQFKPEFKLDLNFDFSAIGNGLKTGLTNIGIGLGGGLVAIASGIIASATARRQNTTIVNDTFEQYCLPTQIQFSTLGDTISSYIRYVSSSGEPNTVPGQEYLVSTIIPSGTLCIRSLGDPVNLADPSTATSSIQSYGQWVEVPVQIPSSISSLAEWSYFPALSSVNMANFDLLNINSASFTGGQVLNVSSINGIPIAEYQNISSISSLNEWAYYDAVSSITFSPTTPAVIQASPGNNIAVSGANIQLIGAYTDAKNLLLVSSISTGTILGANDNLFGVGVQGLQIEANNIFLSSPNVTHPGTFNGNQILSIYSQSVTTSISSLTVSSINNKAPAFQDDINSFSSITTSTLFSPYIVTDQLFVSTQISGDIVASDSTKNIISSFSSIQTAGALFNNLNAGLISSGKITASSITLNSGVYSTIMVPQPTTNPGVGTSTMLTVNTDLNLGTNDLYAQQVRLGKGQLDNYAEILLYGNDGSTRNILGGTADRTIRVASSVAPTGPGYVLDTALNPPFFSTINSSGTVAMMSYFPSSIANTIGVSTIAVLPAPLPLQQFGVSTFQASAFNITLPRNYKDTSYGIQITPMASVVQPPHASTVSVSSFEVHAGGGLSVGVSFFWQVIGLNY